MNVNETLVTVRGYAAAQAQLFNSEGKRPVAIFRIGSTPRHYSRTEQKYVDEETQWFSVRAFGELGKNVGASIRKGDPVLVRGKLVQRTWSTAQNETRIDNVIIADAVGIELSKGQATYTRTRYDDVAEMSGAMPAGAMPPGAMPAGGAVTSSSAIDDGGPWAEMEDHPAYTISGESAESGADLPEEELAGV